MVTKVFLLFYNLNFKFNRSQICPIFPDISYPVQ